MGKKLLTVGLVLLIVGILVTLTGGGVWLVTFMDEISEETVLRTDDFSDRGANVYRATYGAEDLTSSAEVRVYSNNLFFEVEVEVTVRDSDGDQVARSSGETPITLYLDISPGESGDYQFFLEIKDDGFDINDITVTVVTTGFSESFMLCCFGTVSLSILGILMTITGIVLLIINAVRGKDKETSHKPDPYSPRPYGYQEKPPQQSYGPPRQENRPSDDWEREW
ncbi:MAG: hypothetical protein ACMUIE_02580 [Thermoplasmatota archaeon]